MNENQQNFDDLFPEGIDEIVENIPAEDVIPEEEIPLESAGADLFQDQDDEVFFWKILRNYMFFC